jgi:hypothetical protein
MTSGYQTGLRFAIEQTVNVRRIECIFSAETVKLDRADLVRGMRCFSGKRHRRKNLPKLEHFDEEN